MQDFYLKKMAEAEKFTEARNYALAAGYCVGKLIRDRYFESTKAISR